jgi:hypothetical protein
MHSELLLFFFLLIIVVCGFIFCIAYIIKMHYIEIRALYKKLDIDLQIEPIEKKKTSVKNAFKKKIDEMEKRQGGE